MSSCTSKKDTATNPSKPKIKKTKKLYSFKEARNIARSYGFKSQTEFLEYECAGSYQLPKNVDELYNEDDGWKGWNDFLGVPYPFEEAKLIAKKLKETKNIDNKETYLKMKEEESKNKDCDNDYDDLFCRLPYRPDLYYKEWINWEDWFQK